MVAPKKLFHIRQFMLVLLACAVMLAGVPPVQAQEPPPPLNQKLGLVDAFANTAEANAAGAGWTRVYFRWDVIQPGGPSDWKPANVPDPFIDAEVAAGREVVGVIIGTPLWASESGRSTAVPPREMWGDFVFKLATQYQGRVSRWVIWNQPDVTNQASANFTWEGSVEEYAALLKEAYLKIKAVDPTMQVHLAGLTYVWDEQQGTPQYLARLLAVLAQEPDAATNNYFFDVATYHGYYDPFLLRRILLGAREILADQGLATKPIWINETNAPPSEDFIEPPRGTPPFRVSLQEQSAFVLQAFSLALASGAERIAFNKLRNEPGHPETTIPLGLLRGDNSRRPAFEAFQTAARYFADVQQAQFQQLDDVFVVTLERAGQTTTVLWTAGRSPVNFSLSAIAPQALWVDGSGQSQTIEANNGAYSLELPAAECTNGEYCFIGGMPRLVIESGSPAQREALQAPVSPSSAVQASPVPAETTSTPTPLPPTSTPRPVPPTLMPTPTVTPALLPTATATITPAVEALPAAEQQAAATPPPPVLPETPLDEAPPPDSALDPFAAEDEFNDAEAVPTAVPPVSFGNIFRPDRILWLFIIGLIVFTVAYGIQVAIWYRVRR